MKMGSKILTVAIVAMFCATAFAVVAEENDAADKTTYHIYIQLHDNTINAKPVDMWLDAYDASAQNKDNFITALKAGLDKAKMSYDISESGWLSKIADYATHGEWGSTSYYGFAVYYADGKVWKSTSTYDEGTTFAIVFDKYLTDGEYKALSDADKEKYEYNDWGYATFLPTVSTTAWESSSNMGMFLIIGAIVVVVLIIAVFFYTKKQKAQA